MPLEHSFGVILLHKEDVPVEVLLLLT